MSIPEPTGARAATAPGQHHAGLRVIPIHQIIKTSCLLLVALAASHFHLQQNFGQLVQ